MNSHYVKHFFIIQLCVLQLWAGPPMRTNGPFVPNLGQHEINFALFTQESANASSSAHIIDFNYGIFPNTQLTLETAYINSSSGDDMDGLEASLKWNFLKGNFFSVAIQPRYLFYPVSTRFQSQPRYQVNIPMNFALTQKINIIFETRFAYQTSQGNYKEVGTYLNYILNQYQFFLEAYYTDPQSNTDYSLILKTGTLYQFHKNLALMLSWGKEVHLSQEQTEVYSGLQWVF